MKYIYGLIDPDDRSIRYVGQTTSLIRRHIEHVERNEQTPKGQWIRLLREQGKQPDIVCLEVVAKDIDPSEREKWWLTLIEDRFLFELTNKSNPTTKPVSFGDMFSERLRREYDTFIAAIKSQEPVVIITRVQFVAFLTILKLMLSVGIGLLVGYGTWIIEFDTSASIERAVWQGTTAGLSCALMAAIILVGAIKRNWWGIWYLGFYLVASLYVTFWR